MLELHLLQRVLRATLPLVSRDAGVHERQFDVVQGRRARKQIEGLEDESDLFVSNARQLVIRHARNERPVQPILARSRRVEAADDVHERRLARARRSHDRHILVASDGDVDAAQRSYDFAAHVVLALDAARHDHPSLVRRFSRRLDDDPPFGGRPHWWLDDLLAHGHAPGFLGSGFVSFTSAPSFSSRMAWYVPATIFSPSFKPPNTSKCFSPVIPRFTGRNVTLLSPDTTNTPSTSFLPTSFFGFGLPRPTAVSSFASDSFSRTVSAMIGMDSTDLRVSVMILAVAEKSGRVSGGVSTSWIVTS